MLQGLPEPGQQKGPGEELALTLPVGCREVLSPECRVFSRVMQQVQGVLTTVRL